jgi:hypothetical protein
VLLLKNIFVPFMQTRVFNKRHANRHFIDIPALIVTCWEERALVQLKNFSKEGAYFASQVPVERDSPVSVSCIVSVPPLIPGLCLPEFQGRVVRIDCSGFAILLQNNHIIPFVDFRRFYSVFFKNPLPCTSLSCVS